MNGLFRYLKIYRTCVKNALVRELEFRINFLIWGLAMLVEFGIVILFFSMIYGRIDQIAGWSKYEMYFYLGFVQISLTFFMTFVFPNLVALPWQVNGGELDFILLKPVQSQFLVSLKNINLGYVVNLIAGLVLTIHGWRHLGIKVEAMRIIAMVFFGFAGLLILYSIFLIAVTISIWTKRASFASDLFFQLWEFIRKPASVYGHLLGFIFSYLIPVLLIGTVPVEIFLGRIKWEQMSVALVLSLSWFGLSVLFWNYSIKSYTGASS